MCGLCGIYDHKGDRRISSAMLERMLEKIRHRGPDGSQTLVLERVGLGFSRLSFLDLEGGMQPIQNEDRTISMICNGEIFNYQELKDELLVKGHVFRTKTDVEVILHLYEECGTDFARRLNGQFAIALYDDRNKQLLLVRDHIGIAPLFYTAVDGRIVFASEIKAILEYPGVERRLNLKAVDQLMNYPGIVSPVTFFEGIHSLEGGHMLQLLPDQELYYLTGEYNQEILETLKRHRLNLDIYYKALTKEILEELHGEGILVNCWTCDDKEEAERLVSWGVDFITTNRLE